MTGGTSEVNAALIIAVVSLALSLVSTGIAVASFLRTRRIQSFEYAARLQLENENIVGGSGPEAFHYSADLVNSGLKPVEVRQIWMDYGGRSDGTYYKFHVEGLFYVPPGGKRSIRFAMSKQDYEQLLKKFDLEECVFRLRICFSNATGGTVESTRNLMGLGPGKTTIYAQRGDAVV